jgi:glutathione S-transferase
MSDREKLRLYDYPGSCNCYKVRLLLAQLDLPYERITVDIFAGETLTDEFAAINPARSTPVLGTAHGYLPESSAILWYLAQRTQFLPDDPFEAAQVMRWLIFEQTDVIPAIGGLRFRLLVGRWTADDPEAIRRREAADGVLRLLDEHFATRVFAVAERYTIADIALYGYTHRAGEAGIDLGPFRHVRAWLARVEQQPRYLEDVAPYGANAAPGAGRSIYG